MQDHPKRRSFPSRSESSNTNGTNVTSAVGMGEATGRQRARHRLLFTRTVMWITGLVCVAFLFGTLAQAWSNNHLAQQVQEEQQALRQVQDQNIRLKQAANHYHDPGVIESEARQQLGYVRPGEHVVLVVGVDDQKPQHPQPARATSGQQGYWQEWWQAFFGGSS